MLLCCVPLIPIFIAAVQTWAKKLLAKYWGQYTALGDTFLENLQGLTTLKIYQADERRQDIAAVQTWAKKLLAKYWGQYTALGDTFLENLQGLTTLKIYQADERRQEEILGRRNFWQNIGDSTLLWEIPFWKISRV